MLTQRQADRLNNYVAAVRSLLGRAYKDTCLSNGIDGDNDTPDIVLVTREEFDAISRALYALTGDVNLLTDDHYENPIVSS
jgi:hypothetical protein